METKSILVLGVVIALSLVSFGFDSDSLISDEVKKYVVAVDYEINATSDYIDSYINGASDVFLAGGSGVIINNSNGELTVVTNRHVVDCFFMPSGKEICKDIHFERGAIRTMDGKFHDVSSVGLLSDNDNVDLAVLKVIPHSSSVATDYSAVKITDVFSVGDAVTAIGYPSYANGVVEFSVSSGEITEIKEDVYFRKFKNWKNFIAIESDAYTYFGSSGGGLFNSDNELIGINTWGDTDEDRSIAIQALTLSSFDEKDFTFCNKNYYYFSEGKCVPYDFFWMETSLEKVVTSKTDEFVSSNFSIVESLNMIEN